MAATISSRADRGKAAAAAPQRLPHRRRGGMLALAVLLILLGALGAVYLASESSARVPVLMVTRDVPIGTPLAASDLTTVQVAVDPGVQTIPAAQLRDVVNKVSAVALQKGTLLAATQLTTALSPGSGQQVVPIALTPSQIPARHLSPGDQVLLVVIASTSSKTAPTATKPAEQKTAKQENSYPAIVDRVGQEDSSGKIVVDLLVTAEVGPQIARYGAENRLALIVTNKQAT